MSASEEEKGTLIMSLGTLWCHKPFLRFGFRSLFYNPDVLLKGEIRSPVVMTNIPAKPVFGSEVFDKPGRYKLRYLIPRGLPVDWDGLEAIFLLGFYGWDPAELPVFITEPPLNPKASRERMINFVFDRFECPAVSYSVSEAVLALEASPYSNSSGIVINSGEGFTYVAAVYERQLIPHSIQRIELAGGEITDFLMTMLNNECNTNFSSSADRQLVRYIKEACCFISLDYQNDLVSNADECVYRLPDDSVLSLSSQRFRCTEILFDPMIYGNENPGLAELVVNCYRSLGPVAQSAVKGNFVLCGGTVLLPGLVERLEKEVRLLDPGCLAIDEKIILLEDPTTVIWKQALIHGQFEDRPEDFVLLSEYQMSQEKKLMHP